MGTHIYLAQPFYRRHYVIAELTHLTTSFIGYPMATQVPIHCKHRYCTFRTITWTLQDMGSPGDHSDDQSLLARLNALKKSTIDLNTKRCEHLLVSRSRIKLIACIALHFKHQVRILLWIRHQLELSMWTLFHDSNHSMDSQMLGRVRQAHPVA